MLTIVFAYNFLISFISFLQWTIFLSTPKNSLISIIIENMLGNSYIFLPFACPFPCCRCGNIVFSIASLYDNRYFFPCTKFTCIKWCPEKISLWRILSTSQICWSAPCQVDKQNIQNEFLNVSAMSDLMWRVFMFMKHLFHGQLYNASLWVCLKLRTPFWFVCYNPFIFSNGILDWFLCR